MDLISVIRQAWSRHNNRLLRDELQAEATGAHVPGLLSKEADFRAARQGFETPERAVREVEDRDEHPPGEQT